MRVSVAPVTASLLGAPAAAVALAAVAVGAVALAWDLVRRGRVGVWTAMPPTVGLLAVLALFTGTVRLSTHVEALPAFGLGLGTGVLLYGATAAFMSVAGGWPPLRRQARRVYELRGGLPVPAAAALAALVVAPSEEVVWRGLMQTLLGAWVGALGGAAVTWGLYVTVNGVARSLPILLGAVVGGAAWGALAWWTGGVAAPIGCHVVWTALMVVWPPVPSRAR
jgi:membrane protease YdiL (CAAX protease family)